ncbi:MAG: hypothetical protein KAW09_03535 [Thermoplasmata archaeon]|nr:hypothetical protein [Thermoplasmata archaeon]
MSEPEDAAEHEVGRFSRWFYLCIILVVLSLSVVIVHMVSADGRSNWYEGVLLLMVYTIVAIGFFFHP